jgi:hypothetical protein
MRMGGRVDVRETNSGEGKKRCDEEKLEVKETEGDDEDDDGDDDDREMTTPLPQSVYKHQSSKSE